MAIKDTFGKVLERAVARADGWANALTGIGQATRDKRLGTKHFVDLIEREQAESIWRGDDMAARIIEILPAEMLREGYCLRIQDDPGAAELLEGKLQDLLVEEKFREALEYERAYGGSAILMGANDGATDLRMPLNETGIKSLDWLTVLASYELHPTAYYSDPQAPKFGQPMIYQIHPDMPAITNIGNSYVQVHESRFIRFEGIKVSRRQLRQNNGWGDSVLVRCNRVLSDFHQTWASAGILMQDFAQAVLKIKDLADLIATNQDDVVAKRAQALSMSRSVAGMYLIDSEEDFERKATPMTGMPDMLDKFCLRLAASGGLPVSMLLGQTAGGLAAGSAEGSVLRYFYDQTAGKQQKHLKPRLSHLIRLLMLVRGSATRGVEPANWSLDFKPLWQPSAKEEAETRYIQAQADDLYIANGTVSSAEIAVSRFGGDEWSGQTTIDAGGRSALAMVKAPVDEEPTPLRSAEPLPVAAGGMEGINGGPS